MRVAHKIDDSGYFIGDLLIDDDADVPHGVVADPVPQPCISPRWDGQQWVEENQAALDAILSPEQELNQSKRTALMELNTSYESAARPLLREYPEIERLSWGTQQTEATAYRAWLDAGAEGEAPETPALCAILRGRNGTNGTETLEQLVEAVLARAEAFIAWQEFTGTRQRGEWAIQDATTPEAELAVTWESLTA